MLAMTSATELPAPIRAHAAPSTAEQRSHRRAVALWALANGRPLHRDAIAAIVGCRAEPAPEAGELNGRTGNASGQRSQWRTDDIGDLLWNDITTWCSDRGASTPSAPDAASTLDTYLRYLSAHRLLDRGSDPVAALRRAIGEFGGDRSRRRHPSSRQRLAPVVPIG